MGSIAIPLMVWVALLIALSFSSVTLAVGTLAKTFRQGQAYVQRCYSWERVERDYLTLLGGATNVSDAASRYR